MKSIAFKTIVFVFLAFAVQNASAQAPTQATFETYLKTVYDAYDKGGFDELLKWYAPNVTEISPDGKVTNGLAALKSGYLEMEKMMDTKPKFTYQLTSWRLIKPDLALIIWDSKDEFSIQGQQIIGNNTNSALLRKEKNMWLIEFVQLTPKMEFPMPEAKN